MENYLVHVSNIYIISDIQIDSFLASSIAPLSLSLSLIFTNDSSFTLPATHILSSSRFYCLSTPIYTRTKIPPRSLSKVFIIVVNNSRRKPAFHRLQRVYLAYKNMQLVKLLLFISKKIHGNYRFYNIDKRNTNVCLQIHNIQLLAKDKYFIFKYNF